MSVAHLTHPTGERLAAFTAGRLSEPESAEIEAHLADCDVCRTVLEALPEDTLVGLLRAEKVLPAAPEAADLTGAHTVDDGRRPADTDPDAPPDTCTVPPSLVGHARYRVLGLLGVGGMGCVYKAEHRLMERPVALKVISQSLVERPGLVERFRLEVKAAARLSHPHIVAAYDAEQAADTHFLVMEYVAGVSLDRLVRDRGPLPVAEACDYARQAALGLQHAFEHGMVHRDVKPHNLMLTPQGQVKVLDFGLAHFVREVAPAGPVTELGTVMGTPDYIAPEQARDAHTADIRADIYSLGCTLYHLLAGQPPFPKGTFVQKLAAHLERDPQPLSEVRADVPAALSRILDRMMAKDPARRYQTPAAVAEALAPFTGLPAASIRPPRRRRPLVATLLLAALGLAAWQFGPAVYRFTTNRGQLVIETDDPDVQVNVKQKGELVEILDAKTGRTVTLKAGTYQLELTPGKEGLRLSTDQFTLERGGRSIVKVRFEPLAAKKAPAELVGLVRRFKGHTSWVIGVAVSPDGKRALSASWDRTVRLWDVETGKELRLFEGKAKFEAVAFSPDGRRALAGGQDSIMRLWDVNSGEELRRFQGHARSVRAVAFSADGKRVLSGGGDGTVRLWDVETGKELRRFEGHKNGILSVALSADGHRALSGAYGALKAGKWAFLAEPTLRLWDVETGKELRRFEEEAGMVLSVAFARDGRRALSGGNGVCVWDVETGKELRRFAGHEGQVNSVAFAPDGRRALSGADDGTVRLWDVATGREIERFEGHAESVWGVAFLPDGRRALSGGGGRFEKGGPLPGSDFALRLWALPLSVPKPIPLVIQPEPLPDLAPGTPLSPLALVCRPVPLKGVRSWALETRGHRAVVAAVACSPDGRWLATGGEDGVVRLWEADTGRFTRALLGHAGAVRSVAWSPDGKALATGSWDNTVRLWDVESGRLLRTLQGHTDWVLAVAWSPDGQTLASGGSDQSVRLWEAASGKQREQREYSAKVNAVAWSPDGTTLATASGNAVQLWETKTGRSRTFEGHTAPVNAVAWSSDGKALASGGGDKTIRLWDADSGKSLHSVEGHPQGSWGVLGLAWSPAGKALASAGSDGMVRLWEVEAGKLRQTRSLRGHFWIVPAVAWMPDGKTLVSGGGDHDVRLWSADSGELLHTLAGCAENIESVAWSPDGKALACGASRLHVVEAESGRVLRTLRNESLHALAWSPDGKVLAMARWDARVLLLDGASGRVIHTLEGHTRGCFALAWSPDGKLLASGSVDKTIRMWDTSSGKHLRTLEGHTGMVKVLAWSPDAKTLASCDVHVKLRLWEAETGRLLHTLSAAGESLAWSPDGNTLAVGRWTGTAELWNLATGERLHSFPGLKGRVAVAWSADGKTLLTSSDDNVVRVWDTRTRKLLRTIPEPVGFGSFSPDRRLLAASVANTARLGEADTGRLRWALVLLANNETLLVNAEGHYRAAASVQGQLVYVVQTDKGQETLTPEEFGRRYGWKNDPERVRLTGE